MVAVAKKDLGYVRVSTKKESQADSPEHQEALIREHSGRENVHISKENFYEDRDSATSIVSRKDVQKMIDEAKKGKVRSIWFASLSRFSRDAIDALSLKRILVNALRIRVVSIEDGYDSAVKDDELLFGIKSVVNQNTSMDISVSSRRGLRQSVLEKGNFIGSMAPYGYKKVMVGKRKTLEVIPEQAEIVKLIYRLYIDGLGEKRIVNYLNGDNPNGILYPTCKGGPWGLTSIQRILQNEHYTGYTIAGRFTSEVAYNDLNDLMNRGKKLVMRPKDKWERTKDPTHEAIIAPDMFRLAQELRLQRGGGTRGGNRDFKNVFAKLIFCEHCGAAMVTMKSGGKEKEYRYLMCSKNRRTGTCDNKKWIPYFDFRDAVIKESLLILRKMIRRAEKGNTDLSTGFIQQAAVDRDAKKLEKKILDNRKLLMEIRKHYLLGEIDSGQYEFEKATYEKEISDAEEATKRAEAIHKRVLDTERNLQVSKKAVKELTEFKSYDDFDKCRELVQKIIQRIEIDKDGQAKIHTFLNPKV